MCAHLVLLGGGHANLPLVARTAEIVERGHRVTGISIEPTHYYSGMGPGMLGGSYEPDEIRFPIREMVEHGGGRFIQGRAVRIDAGNRTVIMGSGETLRYDILSVNTGSTVAETVPIRPTDAFRAAGTPAAEVFRVKPISELVRLRTTLRERLRSGTVSVAIVGGGPAAVEIAGNVVRIARDEDVSGSVTVQVITGRTILPGFPRVADRLTAAALAGLGVRVRHSTRADGIIRDGLLINGEREPADIIILATGVVPSRLFADSALPTGPDGSLAVDEYLHVLGHREIFGGGDCIWFTPRSLPRAGVFAVREGPVLVENVVASLDRGPHARLRPFHPGGAYLLLLNLGDDTALFWRAFAGFHLVYRGRSAYRLKDRIDRAFMRRFGSEAVRAESGGADTR